MTPTKFEQANGEFGPPEGIDESQVQTVSVYDGVARGGSMDGTRMIVVAWKPDEREIEAIKNGAPIFLTCCGILPPHFLTTNFAEATNPA